LRCKQATQSREGAALPAKAAVLVTFQAEMSWAKELAKLNIDCMSKTDATFQVPIVLLKVAAL
jgi:hypothetical protein